MLLEHARIYLSGPMRGYEDLNYPRFNEVATELRDQGHFVLNPAEHDGGRHEVRWDPSVYLRFDVAVIPQVDCLVLLDGWTQSEGAKLEVLIAQNLDIPVLEWNEGYMTRVRGEVRTAVLFPGGRD